MKPASAVQQLGQSIWIDNISRGRLVSGEFAHLIVDEGVTGCTSNPTIFEQAIAGSADYDEGLHTLIGQGLGAKQIFEAIAVEDLRDAADALRPVYDRTDGVDGYVSIEVSPNLAYDTLGSIEEARRLWRELDRPNVMVKIPGTLEGLPAVGHLLSEGVNINITLLFSVSRHEQVMEAYLAALEARLAAGQPLDRIASVASFFVSRVDTAVDRIIDRHAREAPSDAERAWWLRLRGRIAIANAKAAYERFKTVFAGQRWQRLADAGAHVQRPLWASTGTKDASYSDVLYVDSLIGPHTVNTVPPRTLAAFNDHGVVALTLEQDVERAHTDLRELAELGVDLAEVTAQLEQEGVASFEASFDSLLAGITAKRDEIMAAPGGRR